QWPCSTFPGDKGEIGLQNLPMVDLDHGGSGQPLNIPTQSLSAPKPTSNGTAGSFAAEKAQPTTQGERNAPETLKEHTAAFSKVQLTLQTGRGVVAEESNQPQQAIEIPETVPISAHIRTADLGEAATFVQSLMSTAKARTVVSADQLIRQTFRAVEMMVRLDQSNLHLQLYPESLGRIEIRISQGTEGTHVWMVADQPQTERLLQTGLNELRQSLIHAGIQLADVAVGGQNAHTNLFRQPQGSPMRLQVPLDAISPEVNTEDHRVSRIGASDSYVDYRI
ncbi:MAG: flagellar hook-length control protein FliK, partial [Thermanaerothrix sp.]|nr:flagellar hook-length control protein FliK [Thermanaerothrix sp.]